MRYFRAENLTKVYTNTPIIDHLCFNIEKGDKIALVSKNGGGKSTLLKLMMGDLDVTDGSVERKKGVSVGYLAQHFVLNGEKTVLDEIFSTDHVSAGLIKAYEDIIYNNGDSEVLDDLIIKMDEYNVWSYQSKVDTILARLQLQKLLNHKIKTLSGGEKKRVALAKLLVDEPEVFVLDEPTNHLDLQMIEWLENYLKTEQCTLFLVTHDRYFLENVCSKIYELDRGKLYFYPANYEVFLEKQAERHLLEHQSMEKMYQILKRELVWMRKSPRARATKQHFREKEFYSMEKYYDENKSLLDSEDIHMEIPLQERRLGTKIMKVSHLKKAFSDKVIVKDFSYDFKVGERIGIVGKNGVGKSSFISLLLGDLQKDSGTIEVGKTVYFGHYQQNEINFPEGKRVIDIVKDIAEFYVFGKGEKISAAKLLEMFLFPVSHQYVFANSLSGGEKRRLYLLTVLIKNPNFLILDEPTNDLDLLTISVLEDFLLNFSGCLVIISHDRAFMDRLVDHLFIFTGDGIIQDFWGTYSEWHNLNEDNKVLVQNQKQKNKQEIKGPSSVVQQNQFLSFEEQRELDQLIKDLEALEQEKAEITQLFDNKDMPYDDISILSEHLGEIMKTIDRKEKRWFELIEKQNQSS